MKSIHWELQMSGDLDTKKILKAFEKTAPTLMQAIVSAALASATMGIPTPAPTAVEPERENGEEVKVEAAAAE